MLADNAPVHARDNAFTGAGICVYGPWSQWQSPAITPKAAYTPIPKRAGSRSLSITRSPAQKSACKDLGRNGKARPSRPRPLTLRFLSAPVHAQIKKGQPPKLRLTKIDGVSAIDRARLSKSPHESR